MGAGKPIAISTGIIVAFIFVLFLLSPDSSTTSKSASIDTQIGTPPNINDKTSDQTSVHIATDTIEPTAALSSSITERIAIDTTLSSEQSQKRREPIQVYESCATILSGSKTTVKCDTGFGIDPRFEFFTPDALKNRVILTENSKLYQYSETDFELGLFDQVGEKRYSVRLWELPQ